MGGDLKALLGVLSWGIFYNSWVYLFFSPYFSFSFFGGCWDWIKLSGDIELGTMLGRLQK